MKKCVSVSVVVPCYNCADTIDRAFYSVLEQTVLPIEIILVEDSSSDCGRTLRKLEHLREHLSHTISVVLIKLPKNFGPSFARNAAWNVAKGEYIAFLDSDDSWHPLKIELQFGWMKKNSDYAITGHKSIYFNSQEKLLVHYFEPIKYLSTYSLLWKNYFKTSTVMLRRSIPYRFPDNMSHAEDYFLWGLILSDLNYSAGVSSSVLSFTHKSLSYSSGLSSNLLKMEKGELRVILTICYSNGYSLLIKYIAILWSLFRFLRRSLMSLKVIN